jgi:hypothetical protein
MSVAVKASQNSDTYVSDQDERPLVWTVTEWSRHSGVFGLIDKGRRPVGRRPALGLLLVSTAESTPEV